MEREPPYLQIHAFGLTTTFIHSLYLLPYGRPLLPPKPRDTLWTDSGSQIDLWLRVYLARLLFCLISSVIDSIWKLLQILLSVDKCEWREYSLQRSQKKRSQKKRTFHIDLQAPILNSWKSSVHASAILLFSHLNINPHSFLFGDAH